MKNKTLIAVRSNCDFSLNYDDGTLHPKAEIIILTTQPDYKFNSKKSDLVKDQKVEEFRFQGTLEGINTLIGELQLVVKNMNAFEQTAASFNAIIKAQQERENKKQ